MFTMLELHLNIMEEAFHLNLAGVNTVALEGVDNQIELVLNNYKSKYQFPF
jgi:hypothetical protein